MKISNKFKVFGIVGLVVGVFLVVSAFTIFKTCLNCDSGWEGHREFFGESYSPNLFILFVGSAISIFSISLLFVGFRPAIAKVGAKLHSETIDYAGGEIGNALDKTVDVVAPAVEKTVKTIKKGFSDDIKVKLDEAKSLYEHGDISKEEYEALRKKILNI